ncbi:hypothetical protein [Ferruginibacter profundus]
MKKLSVFFTLIVCSFMYNAQAQVRVNVNINTQPQWGPAGYDYAAYYYMPDMDVYYSVPQRQFIYLQGRNWMFSAALPAQYRDYDLYSCYKVVVNEPRPYLRCDEYRSRYASYRGRRDQVILRDRWERHDNGNHYGWRNQDKHGGYDRGRGHGHGKWKDRD